MLTTKLTCFVVCAGVIADAGMVRCHCQRCNDATVTFSDFEAHAGAMAGRPGESIVLSDCGATLRVRVGQCLTAHHFKSRAAQLEHTASALIQGGGSFTAPAVHVHLIVPAGQSLL